MNRCAFLSMDCLDEFEVYDQLVEPYLSELGWCVDTVSWRKKDVDWSQYKMVVIRTPWDYQDAPEAFLSVLQEIEQSSAVLENSLEIVRWNIDKIYLQQLAEHGVMLIPTIWCERINKRTFSSEQISGLFDQLNSSQIVYKPRISANADNTFWLTQHTKDWPIDDLNQAFAQRDFMVQPFVPAVIEEGEYSLFYFNGKYSHAILKTPKDKDFRVQEEHGGRLQSIEPNEQLLKAATKCMQAISKVHQMPLYARLDLVMFEGEYALMEAELIEPSLYFNMDEASPKLFAEEMVKRFESY